MLPHSMLGSSSCSRPWLPACTPSYWPTTNGACSCRACHIHRPRARQRPACAPSCLATCSSWTGSRSMPGWRPNAAATPSAPARSAPRPPTRPTRPTRPTPACWPGTAAWTHRPSRSASPASTRSLPAATPTRSISPLRCTGAAGGSRWPCTSGCARASPRAMAPCCTCPPLMRPRRQSNGCCRSRPSCSCAARAAASRRSP